MKLNIELDIPKRTMDAVNEYCGTSSITLEEYICDCISNDINVRRYGDLNDILRVNENVNKYDIRLNPKKKPITDDDKPSVPNKQTYQRIHRVIKCK